MKVSTFTTILLVVGILLFVTIEMIKESETNYDIEVNKTEWEEEYQFAEDINETIAPIQKSIKDIENEELGWFEKVSSGFTGIISAVKFVPSLLFILIKLGNNLIVGFGTVFGIPGAITQIFLVMLYIWIIYSIIEFFQRWNI
jgi:hypothetical protein